MFPFTSFCCGSCEYYRAHTDMGLLQSNTSFISIICIALPHIWFDRFVRLLFCCCCYCSCWCLFYLSKMWHHCLNPPEMYFKCGINEAIEICFQVSIKYSQLPRWSRNVVLWTTTTYWRKKNHRGNLHLWNDIVDD